MITFSQPLNKVQALVFQAQMIPQVRNESVGQTLLGTYIYDTLILTSPQYEDDFGNVVASDFIRLDNCILNVNIEILKVKKQVKGKDGSDKQYIGIGDHVINCFGKLVSNGHTLPIAEMEKLVTILKCPVSLDYESRFLSECFKIKRVTADNNPKFYQLEGVENAYNFEFQLLSDD